MKDILLITHFLIFVFCFVGCRSTRATLTQDISAKEEIVTSSEMDGHKEVQTAENEWQTVHIEESQTEEITTIEYSLPDTTGKQFITRITIANNQTASIQNAVIERLKAIGIQENIHAQKHETTTTQINEHSTLKQQSKTRVPAWIYLAGSVVLGIVLIAGYRLIKQFKIK